MVDLPRNGESAASEVISSARGGAQSREGGADRPRLISFEAVVESLGPRPDAASLRREFSPPMRFASRTFANYLPQHQTQTAAKDFLQVTARRLGSRGRSNLFLNTFATRGRGASGIYLDGGFGVGKTHLLAALWHAAPEPKAYLTFDELMFFVGLIGVQKAAAEFDRYRLIAVDEWELDDPGNLKLAIAFLRPILASRACVAVTSNTLPLELGAGRFSQKEFTGEVEELAAAFEVLRIEGADYRHRQFEATPGRRYFCDDAEYARRLRTAAAGSVSVRFEVALRRLAGLHPIRYRELAARIPSLFIEGVASIPTLSDALRWVHFIDSVYDSGAHLTGTGDVDLGEIFTATDLQGPFAKKLSRCLSRMEELLAESA